MVSPGQMKLHCESSSKVVFWRAMSTVALLSILYPSIRVAPVPAGLDAHLRLVGFDQVQGNRESSIIGDTLAQPLLTMERVQAEEQEEVGGHF